MSINLKISGINAVLSGLDDFSEEIQRKVQEEVRDWAERTEAAAKRDVPVKTGDLKGSIRSVVGANGLTWIVKAGNSEVDYAPYVEFGTGTRVDQAFLQEYGLVKYASDFKGKGEREVNLPARTFLYRNARTELTKSIQAIRKLIEAEAKK